MFTGKDSGERVTRQTSWWEVVTGHPRKMKIQMKYSVGSWEKCHACQTLFLWRTSMNKNRDLLIYNTAKGKLSRRVPGGNEKHVQLSKLFSS